MEKTVYLVIPDLHKSYKNLANRVDYKEEVNSALFDIYKIASKYKGQGCKVVTILLGDIFHNSYKDVISGINDCAFFFVWKQKIGEIYTVIGNHELTYYTANPFYALVTNIESKKIQKIMNKVWTPLGLISAIRVVDQIEDGNLVFHFNHYGTAISKPEDGKINVGLFHQNILCKELVSAMELKLGYSIYAETVNFSNLDIFNGYQYALLGHTHSVYGTWKCDNGCFLSYLASIGRTNVKEVNDQFLQRCIPAFVVKEGVFSNVEENYITLKCREESVNEIEVLNCKEKYHLEKIKKEARLYEPIGDNPINNLKEQFLNNKFASLVLNGLLQQEIDPIGETIMKELEEVIF